MHVIDLEGKEFPIQVTSTNEGEVNGDQSLSATILPTKVNKAFIADIAEMWNIVDHDDVEHKIIYAKRKGKGDQMTVEIKAIPLFFDALDNDRLYDRYDGSMTAVDAFDKIFKGTGFGYTLVDSFDAYDWENFGNGETKLAMFKKALDHYDCEFRITGNTVYLENQIGRDTQFMYRYRLNASNIEQEIDAEEMWTYIKGYADYDDTTDEDDDEAWTNAKIKKDYTSPLEKILGKRHAPPVKDGRIKHVSTLKKKMKKTVDESIKISLSADIHDLRRQGYPLAQPQLGDKSFLIDERIGLNEEIRIVSINIKRDWQGNVLDLTVEFGNEGLSKRHQADISSATKDIKDLLEGRSKLPYSVLDDAVKNATKALHDAETELKFNDNGILAIDKKDPNKVVLFNSAGVGVSDDGGAKFKTAMTGDGLVADVVTSGTLNTDNVVVRGGDDDEFIYMSGDYVESHGIHDRQWRGKHKGNQEIKLMFENGQIRARNEDQDWSLYVNDQGITTFDNAKGYDGHSASGYIEFHSREYSKEDEHSGLTIGSQAGRMALESNGNRMYLNPAGSEVYVAKYNQNMDENVDYYNLRANYLYANALRKHPNSDANGNNFYISVSGEKDAEVRITNFNLYNDGDPYYKDLRARYIYAKNMSNHYSDTFMYLGSDKGVRVTSRGMSDKDPLVYRKIQAKSFDEKSTRKRKRNIDEFDGKDVLDKIKGAPVYTYHSDDDADDSKKQLGVMIEESPSDIHGDDGESVSMYSMNSYLWRGMQKVIDRLEKLEANA